MASGISDVHKERLTKILLPGWIDGIDITLLKAEKILGRNKKKGKYDPI